MKIDYKSFLAIYESPSICEYISNKYLQKILTEYLVWKIKHKWKRYKKRIDRDNYLKDVYKNQ